MKSEQIQIINSISYEILQSLEIQKSEESQPSTNNADKMDGIIKKHKDRVNELRSIRDKLEEIFSS